MSVYYPYYSCLCTFWPCHPYLLLQFLVVFILVLIYIYIYIYIYLCYIYSGIVRVGVLRELEHPLCFVHKSYVKATPKETVVSRSSLSAKSIWAGGVS